MSKLVKFVPLVNLFKPLGLNDGTSFSCEYEWTFGRVASKIRFTTKLINILNFPRFFLSKKK